MGTKVDGFIALVEKLRSDDPLAPLADAVESLLRVDIATDDVFEAADELQAIGNVKALLKVAVEAVNEQVDRRNEILYDEMVQSETQNFQRKGQTFYLTATTYVQAKPEIGGTSSPELIQWLVDQNLGDIAKKNVNANSLRATVNSWREEHPITAVEDGEELDGEALLAALGMVDIVSEDGTVTAEQQYEDRVYQYERLEHLVNMTEKPLVGVRKAAK